MLISTSLSAMRISSNLPRIIAIPLVLIIIAGSIILFSVFFAILLIPMAIMGYKFWRSIKLAQKLMLVTSLTLSTL